MSFPSSALQGPDVRELLWAARLDDVTEAPAPQSKPGSAAAPAGRYLIIATGEPGGYTALSSAYAEVVQRLEGALGQAGERHVEVLREPRADMRSVASRNPSGMPLMPVRPCWFMSVDTA